MGPEPRATIPLFKKIGFVDSNNAPTELYSKFRTDRKRGLAVYEGLKNGFSEIFKRSEFAYSLSDDKITDIIVEITGLSKSDRTVSAIKSTFLTLCSYLPTNFRHDVIENGAVSEVAVESSSSAFEGPPSEKASVGNVGLSYNINIVLPETSDVAVLNAIFKSLKANILQ